jgi:hypothetical protein
LRLEDRIRAATRLQAHIPGWQRTERSLDRLAAAFPNFDEESVLLKVVTVNSLYATNVYATVRMAHHITSVLADPALDRTIPELVERIAWLDSGGRRHRSFASKFSHFFIDASRFPILDQQANAALRYHLGRDARPGSTGSYTAFIENFWEFWRRAEWGGSVREVDRYLWLAGTFRQLRKNAASPVNVETRALYADPSAAVQAEIALVLGEAPSNGP